MGWYLIFLQNRDIEEKMKPKSLDLTAKIWQNIQAPTKKKPMVKTIVNRSLQHRRNKEIPVRIPFYQTPEFHIYLLQTNTIRWKLWSNRTDKKQEVFKWEFPSTSSAPKIINEPLFIPKFIRRENSTPFSERKPQLNYTRTFIQINTRV